MNISIFLLQIILQLIALRVAFTFGQVALGAFVVLEAVLANLFVLKQITLFNLSVTASDSFIIGSMIGLSLYQELFGKEASKKLGLITFGSLFFVTLTSMLHIWLVPHSADVSQSHYHFILSAAPRIVASSLIAYFLASRADVLFFAFLKNTFTRWSFGQRTLISTLITQALDTCVFSFLALYGVVDSLFHIIIFSFFIKSLCLITYLILQPLMLKPKAQAI
jgi:uncharacterized integral membrane protein (TIGR00697 family)